MTGDGRVGGRDGIRLNHPTLSREARLSVGFRFHRGAFVFFEPGVYERPQGD